MTEAIEKTDETVNLGTELSKSSLASNGEEINLEKAEFYKEEGNKAFKGTPFFLNERLTIYELKTILHFSFFVRATL
jgi:hypothetical protein